MPNWHCTRDALKRASGISGSDRDATVDRLIDGFSRQFERATRRRFIPETATYPYPWPQHTPGRSHILWLPGKDLLSVSTLLTQAQDSSPTTIAASDYYLEPQDLGPPYNRIEIDLSSTAAFEAGSGSSQRSISVAGSWGYGNDTATAGTVASGLDSGTTATSMVCSNASLVGVGDTLLIESEQVFVSDRSFAALGSILLDGALTASKSEVTITIDAGHDVQQGEVVQFDSERMYVESVATNDLSVIRSYDGTTLAVHNNDTPIQINRTLTIVRNVNGTTAATHANATAMTKYQPPTDVVVLCVAETIAAYHQEGGGWGRSVGTGEGARELSGRALDDLRIRTTAKYRRARTGVI